MRKIQSVSGLNKRLVLVFFLVFGHVVAIQTLKTLNTATCVRQTKHAALLLTSVNKYLAVHVLLKTRQSVLTFLFMPLADTLRGCWPASPVACASVTLFKIKATQLYCVQGRHACSVHVLITGRTGTP